MDQVPLPFVVSQDSTCTDDEDKDVHVKAPSDALRKRQFTMNVICNAGEGEERDGHTVLTCKGRQKGVGVLRLRRMRGTRKFLHYFKKNACRY